MKLINLMQSKNKKTINRLCIASVLFLFASSTFAQNQQISLSGNNLTLKKAFNQIEQQASLSIDYDGKDIDSNRTINIASKTGNLSEILKMLLQGTNCAYTLEGKHIIIKQRIQQASKRLSGTINDVHGEPVIGANVVVEGTTNGTITDMDGKFFVEAPIGAILRISYIGYLPQEIKVGNQSQLNITLKEDSKALEEVVVVGYGIMKKKDLTGSISSIKADDIKNVASSNALQVLQAKVPGLDIQQADGQAGIAFNMLLRGNRSISAGNGPLILVDGVQYGSTLDLNASDIESIDILKDASSTAIYGTKGANGVILITTKRGSSGKTVVNFNGYLSMNSPSNTPKLMYGEREMQRLIDKTDYNNNYNIYIKNGEWGTTQSTYKEILGDLALEDGTTIASIYEDGSFTNWSDFILKNSTTQNYELSVSGGNENTNFNFSLGALYDSGLIKNDKLNRYNGKINLDHKVNKYIKAGTSILYTYRSNNKRDGSIYVRSLLMSSLTHPYLNDGTINATPNPFYPSHSSPLLDEVDGNYDNKIETTRFFGNFYIQLTPLKGLILKSLFAVDRRDVRDGKYQDMESGWRYQSPHTSYITNNNFHSTALTWDNTINYTTDFNNSKHNLVALLGNEVQQTVSESATIEGDAGAEHYYNSSFYDTSKILDPKVYNSYVKQSMLSYFGRLNYTFNNKYLLTASLRADGSSTLAKGHKWGYFPSVALAWRMEEESFMKSMKSWLNSLKIRGSWGKSGNAGVGAYSTLTSLSNYDVYYYMGATDIKGKVPNTMGNKNLTWEKTKALDLGIDFGILNNRIFGNIDYFKSKTNDLLYYKSVPPSSVYPTVLDNIGSTKAHGVEISITAIPFKLKNFSWNVNISYTRFKDKVTKLADGIKSNISGNSGYIVGQPISIYYDYIADGCWNIGEYEEYLENWNNRHPNEKASYPNGYGKPGSIKIIDKNDDGKLSSSENEDDRKIYKRSPDHIIGMNNTFAYKDFSLDVQLYARIGGYISYGMNSQLSNEALNWGDLDYWTPTNTNAKFPNPGAMNTIFSSYGSTLLYEKADCLKFKDITLRYNIPRSFISKFGISNLNIYGSMKNYITISKIHNYDPERGGSLSFPLQKQIVFGINLQF